VLDNRDLAEVSWEQREMEGSPRFEASQRLPAVPYEEYAHVLGLRGERVSTVDALDGAWARAFAADRPFVLAIETDPATPMVPPLAAAGEKVEQMRSALATEAAEGGPQAQRALRLLAEYVEIERREGGV
jgi:pyruvate dehydrogenase (quinone)